MIDEPKPTQAVLFGIPAVIALAAWEASPTPFLRDISLALFVLFGATAAAILLYSTMVISVEVFRVFKHAATETPRSHYLDSLKDVPKEMIPFIPRPSYGINVGNWRNNEGAWDHFILVETDEWEEIKIPFDFAEKFINNSDDRKCWSERSTSDKTEERKLYQAFALFLWKNEFAELPRTGRPTLWIDNGRARIAHELGIELVPDLRSVVVEGRD